MELSEKQNQLMKRMENLELTQKQIHSLERDFKFYLIENHFSANHFKNDPDVLVRKKLVQNGYFLEYFLSDENWQIRLEALKHLNFYKTDFCVKSEKEEVLIELLTRGLVDFNSIHERIKSRDILSDLLNSDVPLSIEDLTKIYKETTFFDIKIYCLQRGLIDEDLKSLDIDISKNLKNEGFRQDCINKGYFLNEILELFYNDEVVIEHFLRRGYGNMPFMNLKLYQFALKECRTSLIERTIFEKGYDLEYSLLETKNNIFLKDYLPLINCEEILKVIRKRSTKPIKNLIDSLMKNEESEILKL